MKTITIYKRTILERTQFRKWRYKEGYQISIFYDGKEHKNHDQTIDNKRLQKPFEIILNTRKKEELKKYFNRLGWSDVDKWQKSILKEILENE